MDTFTLSYGSPQVAVLAITAALSAIVAGFLIYAAAQTRKDMTYEAVATAGYRFRRPWGLGLTLLLVILGALSLSHLPFGMANDGPTSSSTVTVRATASQFAFTLSPTSVRQGDRVQFEVTATDVNHGFGIYDPKGRLLGQAQAMPGRINRFALDLDQAGTYKILCMEYCGLFHHNMLGSLEVTSGRAA